MVRKMKRDSLKISRECVRKERDESEHEKV